MLLSSDQVSKQLQIACDLTQQILVLVKNAEYEELAAVETERQKIIQTVFSQNKELIEREKAEELLQLNQQVETLLIKEKNSIQSQQKKIRRGKYATNAYLQNN